MDILESGRSAMRHAGKRQSTLDRIKGYLPEDGKTKKTLVTVGALALVAGVFIAKSGCEYDGAVDDSSNADIGIQQPLDTPYPVFFAQNAEDSRGYFSLGAAGVWHSANRFGRSGTAGKGFKEPGRK